MIALPSENRKTSRDSILIFTLGLLVFTIGLCPEFIGPQCRYALFAQEMLRQGPTFFPTTYGNAYPDHPATSTYLTYVLSLAFKKVTMLSAVLPTAITSASILVVIYRIGATQSRKWGTYAAIFALFTHEFLVESRSICLDQYTSLATVLCFYLAYSASLLGRQRRLWFIPVLFVVGFCFRGPIGLVIPAVVTFVFYLWEKQYKRCLILAVATMLLFGLCLAILLAAAYRQGGNDLVERVAGAQGSGRLGYYASNYSYYFVRGFTAYAVSLPLAVIALLASGKRFFKRETLNDRLPGHLVFWVAIIVLGMSIPGTKRTHYILPVAPALSLLASYLFIRMESEGLGARAGKAFLGLCRMLPFAVVVAAAASCIPNRYFTAVPALSGLVTLILLIGLVAVRWTRKFREYSRDGLTAIPVAALSFIVFNIGVIGPTTCFYERTKPFVEKVETLLASRPGTIAFYRIGPDGEDIKFMVNTSRPLMPVFIQDEEDLLRQSSRTYFIARQKDIDRLPQNIADKMQVQVCGKIGHRNYVVFSVKPDVMESSSVMMPDPTDICNRREAAVANSILL